VPSLCAIEGRQDHADMPRVLKEHHTAPSTAGAFEDVAIGVGGGAAPRSQAASRTCDRGAHGQTHRERLQAVFSHGPKGPKGQVSAVQKERVQEQAAPWRLQLCRVWPQILHDAPLPNRSQLQSSAAASGRGMQTRGATLPPK